METKLWELPDSLERASLALHPDPESLLKPPWECWRDHIHPRWLVKSPNKPKDALVYGIAWLEVKS